MNPTDGNRKTPLHLASNNKKMARLLIRYGADAFVLDKDEDMPLLYGLRESVGELLSIALQARDVTRLCL